jgi:hypothetical protein
VLLVIQCTRHAGDHDRDRYRDGDGHSRRQRDGHVDAHIAGWDPGLRD